MNTGEIVLAGSAAVVTGAANGIGEALALQLADMGLDLAIADIDVAGLDRVAAEVARRGVRVIARALNVADFDQVQAFANEVFAWADRVSLVYANAGVHGLTDDLDPDLAVWDRVIAVNLKGPVHMVKAFLPRLVAAEEPAQFVITASQASFLASPGMAPYVSSKHAMWGMADGIRLTLAKQRSAVGISIVAPGRTESGITRMQLENARARGGDAAAQAYQNLLVSADAVAQVMIRQVLKRAFWIIPSGESSVAMLQSRVDAIVAAFPAGAIGSP